MADMTEVYAAFKKADAAGNTADAKRLADYIRSSGSSAPPAEEAGHAHPSKADIESDAIQSSGVFDALAEGAHLGGEKVSDIATAHGAPPAVSAGLGAIVPTATEAASMLVGGKALNISPRKVKDGAEALGTGASNLYHKITSGLSGVRDTFMGIPAKSAKEMAAQAASEVQGAASSGAKEAASRSLSREAMEQAEAKKAALVKSGVSSAEAEKLKNLNIQEQHHGAQAKRHIETLSAKPVRDEEIGAHIQTQGQKHLESAHGHTVKEAITKEKDPAFLEARSRAEKGDTLTTNPNSKPILDRAVKELEQQIKDSPATASARAEMTKNIQNLFGEETALSEDEQRVENLRASIEKREPSSTKNEGLTLHQAEYLRRWAQDPMSREQSGFGSLKAANMADFGKLVREAQIAYEPRVGAYIEKYAAGKKAEEAISSGKKGLSVTKADAEADGQPIFNLKPQSVASHYLDGTKTSAEKLVRLVGGDKKEISGMVGGNLRHKMESMTPEQAKKFLEKNRGLLEVFPEFKQPLENVVKHLVERDRVASLGKDAETALTSAQTATTKAEEGAATAGAKHSISAKQYQGDITKINDPSLHPDKIPNEALKIAEKMRADGFIDKTKYYAMTKKIEETRQLFENQRELEKNTERYRKYMIHALELGAVGELGYQAHKQGVF